MRNYSRFFEGQLGTTKYSNLMPTVKLSLRLNNYHRPGEVMRIQYKNSFDYRIKNYQKYLEWKKNNKTDRREEF